jgi:hypothetical protein
VHKKYFTSSSVDRDVNLGVHGRWHIAQIGKNGLEVLCKNPVALFEAIPCFVNAD